MERKKYKRRQYLINRKFQFSFIGWAAGMAAIIVGIFYGANLYFFNTYFEKGRDYGLPPDHFFFKFVTLQFNKMNAIFFVTSLVAFLVITISGLFFSHKICGPLFKLTKHLQSLTGGDSLTEVHFRSGDFFKEVEVAFNNFLGTVSRTDADEKALVRSSHSSSKKKKKA